MDGTSSFVWFSRFVLSIGVTRFSLLLQTVVLGLAAAHVITHKAANAQPNQLSGGLVWLFDMNGEANVPALFSSGLWLLAAVLALAVGSSVRGYGNDRTAAWTGMAFLFVFLALDEAVQVHERVGAVIDGRASLSGFFHYGWVFAGIGFLLTMGLVFLPLLLRLRPMFALLLVLSGAIFVSGALGIEMLGAAVESGSMTSFPLRLNWTRAIVLEEALEMTGVVLLIYTLLRMLSAEGPPYRREVA